MTALRVLHAYRTYFPETQGGGQEAIRQISLATQALGVTNTVFALARHPIPAVMTRPEGLLVRSRSWLEIASCDIGGPDAFRRFGQLARQADVIHLHYPWPFADVLLEAAAPARVPVVLTYHSDVVRQGTLDQVYEPLRRRLFARASAVVATSPAYAASSPVLQRLGRKVLAIPLCLGPEDDAGGHQKAPAGGRIEALAQQPYFLFVGVLRYYKGLHTLIDAAPKVRASIVILGDGPEAATLQARARRAGADRVRFVGALNDDAKRDLLAGCRALVLPSHRRSEAFGLTLLEASRAGRPMISCEIGTGTSWVNQNGVTGLVVPPEVPDALANAMNRLADDAALAHRMGAAARDRWSTTFSPARIGQAYADLYRQVRAGLVGPGSAPAAA